MLSLPFRPSDTLQRGQYFQLSEPETLYVESSILCKAGVLQKPDK